MKKRTNNFNTETREESLEGLILNYLFHENTRPRGTESGRLKDGKTQRDTCNINDYLILIFTL
jgi:hypothetical protein